MHLPGFPVRFDDIPLWGVIGLFLLLAIPTFWLGARSMAGLDPFRKWASVGLRLDLLLLLLLALSGARWVEPIKDMTVVFVQDVSRSIQNVPSTSAGGVDADIAHYITAATERKPRADRVGLVQFDGRPWIESIPDVTLDLHAPAAHRATDGTDIAQAIQLALAAMPIDTMHRIVLVSDGNATTGDLGQAIASAAAQHTRIDVVPLDYNIAHEISIDKFIVPSTKTQDAPITLEAVIRSQNPGPVWARLSFDDGGAPLPMDTTNGVIQLWRNVLLSPGANVERLRLPAQGPGVHRYRAMLEPLGPATDTSAPPVETDPQAIDTIAQNNTAQAITLVLGQSKVLQVNGAAAQSDGQLQQTLLAQGITVETASPEAMPRAMPDLQQYDAIVLNDVPRGAGGLDPAQEHALLTYVNDLGGGLAMIGGPQSFGAGGWIGSDLETILPVDCEPPARQMMPAGALVIVIDHSGSMQESLGDASQSKEQAADESAVLALKALSPEDKVGVIAFDTEPTWVVPLGPNTNAEATAKAIREISPAGGTEIYPALVAADEAMARLSPTETPVRHVVLLTDGDSLGGDFDRVISEMAHRGVTLSTVGLGSDVDENLLKHFALLGKGRYYFVNSSKSLPQIFIKEAMTLRKTLIRERPFVPRQRPGVDSLVGGLGALPRLLGMVRTWPKSDPRVQVPLVSDTGDPVLANWQVGLGHVAAFTSDAQSRWAADWIASPIYAPFWSQIVRGIRRPTMSNAAEAHIVANGSGHATIRVEATGSDPTFQNVSGLSAAVFGPDTSVTTRSVKFVQTGPGTFEGDFDTPDPGAYLAMVSLAGQNISAGWTDAAYIVDGSAEWHDLQSNPAVLHQIAERTGGRLIQPFDTSVNVFDRQEEPTQYVSTPLTERLLVWSMVTLLLDVAVRRIAWDRQSVRMAARVFATSLRTFTHVRAPTTQASVEALRNVRQNSAVAAMEAPKPIVTDFPEKSRQVQSRSDVVAAPETTMNAAPSAPMDYFGSLAAAKRRAREKIRQDE